MSGSTDGLKPCPFCGPLLIGPKLAKSSDGETFYVTCRKCGSGGPTESQTRGARIRWNTRPPSEESVRAALSVELPDE